MWTQDANAPGPAECHPKIGKTWQQALDYVTCLNSNAYLGYTDWRLPNRKELHSLTDYSRYNPALPAGHPFTNVQANFYWSSTTFANSTGGAWIVSMYVGYVGSGSKGDPGYYGFYVWPVRSGQTGPLGCSSWNDVISKYSLYVSGSASWNNVITCYTQYVSP
jgi:hypothetical protein